MFYSEVAQMLSQEGDQNKNYPYLQINKKSKISQREETTK